MKSRRSPPYQGQPENEGVSRTRTRNLLKCTLNHWFVANGNSYGHDNYHHHPPTRRWGPYLRKMSRRSSRRTSSWFITPTFITLTEQAERKWAKTKLSWTFHLDSLWAAAPWKPQGLLWDSSLGLSEHPPPPSSLAPQVAFSTRLLLLYPFRTRCKSLRIPWVLLLLLLLGSLLAATSLCRILLSHIWSFGGILYFSLGL